MLALAGELADGALLDFFVPPAYTARARRLLADGIRRAGRAVDPFLTPQLIACAVDDRDPAAAVGQCRLVLARYLAQQPHIGAASGADPELVSRLRATVGWPATTAQIEEAARLVPLDLVRGVAAYVSGRIAKLAPDSIRLETPAAIIGVRGTTLAIRVQG